MAQVAALLAETDPTVTVKAVLARHGGDRRSERAREQGSRPTLIGRGSDYLEARLRRDDPDMAAHVERGELSANAVAVAKGWRKPRSAFRDLVAAWNRADDDERARFGDFIAQWRPKETVSAAGRAA